MVNLTPADNSGSAGAKAVLRARSSLPIPNL